MKSSMTDFRKGLHTVFAAVILSFLGVSGSICADSRRLGKTKRRRRVVYGERPWKKRIL